MVGFLNGRYSLYYECAQVLKRAVGFGGRVPLHLRGALEVANLTALHELSARIITAPELSLSVAGSVTVRAWPGLLFEGITLAKQFRLRGMGGLAARTTALQQRADHPRVVL